MARTASTGFFPRKSLYGSLDHCATVGLIIANSATIKIGDAIVTNEAGFARRSAAGEPIVGVALGLTDANGLNVFTPQASGLTGSTLTEDDTIAVSSTNQSDATRSLEVQIYFDPAGVILYYNDADADLAATNDLQYFDNAAAGSQITASTNLDTNGQWQLISRDPDGDADLSKGLFRIAENQLSGGIDSATDKIPA